MASVLVDPNDISYMDDVEDEDELSEVGSEKRQKKRKNRIIHEAISINSNEPMVKELRQDRQRLLSEKDENKSHTTDTSLSMLHELQKDRKESLKGKRARQPKDKTDGVDTSNVTDEPTYDSISEAKAPSISREKIKMLRHEVEVEVISDTSKLLKPEGRDENKAQKMIDSLPTHNGKDYDFKNVSSFEIQEEQIQEDLKNLQAAIQVNSSGNFIILDQEDSNKEDICKGETGANQIKSPEEEIVRPKQISEAKILMTDEPSTSGAAVEDFQKSEATNTSKRSSKERTKSKTKKELAGIQIIVTEPQDSSEIDSLKKPNGNVQGKKGKTRSKSEKSDTSAEVSEEESSGLSGIVSLNFLRRLSSDGKKSDGASNDLLIKRALYEQSKAKPFKKLAKIKNGMYEVGIEGDVKRSYIKAITIMPDKKLVMFDRSNGCLKLYDNDFNPLDRISVPVKFCGLAPVFETTLAATFPEKKQLQLYHIDGTTNSFQKERTQTTVGEYYAIAHHDNKLYMLQRQRTHDRFSDDKWSIHKMDLNLDGAAPLVLHRFCPGHKDNNLCVNSEGVYLTNKLEGEILNLDHDGTYKYRGRLDNSLPMCITCDGQGNLFVCGGSINSFIEVFKPDLKGSKIIFNKKAQDLVAMCYDKQSNYLYVSDKISGRVLRYKIEHNGFVHGLMRSIVTGSGISC